MSLLTAFVKPLAYLSLPVFVLHTASNASPLARYYVRLGLYLSTVGICSVWGVFASIGLTLLGRRFDTNWVIARTFYGIAGRLLGITIEVEGEEHLATRPAILVANHQSMLDVLFIGRIFPQQGSISAKKELKYVPLLGQFMTLSGAVFIDRKNNSSAVKSVAEAGETMRARKTALWVFPEGTRTNKEKPDLLPFKKGAFHLAVQAGVPITPVVCEHYWRLYHHGTFDGGKLKIRVLPPIPTAGLSASDVGELAQRVREQMLAALYDISGVRPEAAQPPSEEKSSAEDPVPVPDPAELSSSESRPAEAPVEITRDIKKEGTSTIVPLAIDTSSTLHSRQDSDRGADTEEDEGMVLVGRPSSDSDVSGKS